MNHLTIPGLRRSALAIGLALATAAPLAGADDIHEVVFDQQQASAQGSGIEVSGSEVRLTVGGSYRLSGSSNNGRLIVDAVDQPVVLILDNLHLTSENGAAIEIAAAGDTELQLQPGSQNELADTKRSGLLDGAANAPLYSRADLKIIGAEGASLLVKGNLADGIVSKDDLDFRNANVTVEAVDDGIRGKDSVDIRGSRIQVRAGDDAIKSDNKEREDKGFVHIEDSQLEIHAGDDGIQGVNAVDLISGRVRIEDSFEGVEGRNITIHGGQLYVSSRDDALNVSEPKADGLVDQVSGMWKGKGGHGDAIDGHLTILGGRVYLKSQGDGFDSNGHASMSGGSLVIEGPMSRGDGYIDVDGVFNVTGGNLLAMGSSGMAQTPSDSSSQPSIQVNLEEAKPKGTLFQVLASNGKPVLDLPTPAEFQSLTLSSPDLQLGETYQVLVDGTLLTEMTLAQTNTSFGNGGKRGRGQRGDRPWWDFLGGRDKGERGEKGERGNHDHPPRDETASAE